MKSNIAAVGLLVCLLSFVWGCEKDDICLEGTPGTPRLQYGFFDYENPEIQKPIARLSIKAVSIDSIVPGTYTNLLPLQTDQPFTVYEFILNPGSEQESSTLVQFNYDRWDEYLNRACGYRANFILNAQSIAQKNPENSWIKGFEIIQDTIRNEETLHLALYH
ncbi:MAG: DUF6452 family protein [Flavobacteriaceae bacterium]